MSEPEIDRRCVSCGVSVRSHAMFCPQCGKAIPETPADAKLIPAPPPARQHDGVKGRVEKLRHVSSVVIDQAAYDPSLRFLLVAAAMFLLFLVLLIMSKVIG
ncbi:MAG TPA: zinc ribbon domain-containing protein, partial [Pyrinomonadaceae bacterium]|nr:zinc ribbon domain-containing protein [Pyrinomonadaceae bacterium]